jgi:hypothetical protein
MIARVRRPEILATGTAVEREAARLFDRLAAIAAEQATLEAELAAFEADYTRQVVTVLAQLHELEARILGLVARRSGAAADARAAGAARTRAKRTTSASRPVPAPAGPLPTADLKRLFREAAKLMHPDLAPSDEAREHAEAFMKRLNQAYRAADAEAIHDLVRQWHTSPFAGAPERAPEEHAARRLGTLQAAVARAQRRLEEVRGSELAELMERAMAAAAEGTDLIAEMRASAEAALTAARLRLAELQS